MNRLALAIAVIACGCTSFDSIDRGVCGNGLVEAGEDCDTSDASCVRCAVVCTEAADCPTADYACGVDGLCHAPSGALGAPVPGGPFQISDLYLSDIDHDGTGDVLGLSRTSIVVRYGEASGRLSDAESLITPSQSGPPAIGDLDKDGSLDVTITTPDGMVAYTSQYGTLSPLALQSLLVEESGEVIDIRAMFRVNDRLLGAWFADAMDRMYLGIVNLDDIESSAFEVPCAARLGITQSAALPLTRIDTYSVSDNLFNTDTIVAFSTVGPNAKLCVLSIHKDLFSQIEVVDITPTNAVATQRKPVLADLDDDADRCPSLINADGGAMSRFWDGDMVTNRCLIRPSLSPLGDTFPTLVGAGAGAVVIDRVALTPAIAGYSQDAIVMTDGIYAVQLTAGIPSAAGLAFPSPRKLASAEDADLNGDGQNDAILVPESADDLDLILRTQTLFPSYQLLRLDTASRVVATSLGDFDGNGIKDIAYVEQLTDHQRLMVAYGTSDRPLDPIELGSFAAGATLVRLGIPDTVDLVSLADDLIVHQPPPPGAIAPLMTILHGSPQRTMLGYFDPRPKAPVELDVLLFRGAVTGKFSATAGTSGYNDLFAVAIDPRVAPVNPPRVPTRGWRMEGSPFGPSAVMAPGNLITNLADCADSTGGSLCVQDVAYLAWPLTPTKDTVIAVDRATSPHAVTFDPAGAATIEALPNGAVSAKVPERTVIRAMYATDFDGDGALELVATFTPRALDSKGAILVCQVMNGVPQSCTDLVPAILEATAADGNRVCVDAAPGRISFRGPLTEPQVGSDLVVLCRGDGSRLYRVRSSETGLDIVLLGKTTTALGAVRVGDVTGDKVDDVVAVEGDSGAQSLVVFPQCSSRDADVCRGGGGS